MIMRVSECLMVRVLLVSISLKENAGNTSALGHVPTRRYPQCGNASSLRRRWYGDVLIEYPARRKYLILDKQIWEILILVEKQGGNKAMAIKINKIFEEITRERDM